MTPPHDISGKAIKKYLSKSENAQPLIDMMRRSYEILSKHPVNIKRQREGKRPANSIWLWGEGTRPAMGSFEQLFGIKGGVVSAVDLIKGIGRCAGMDVAEVPGATGYIDTDFEGKAKAALKLLEKDDLVYIHFEAPDECGHRGEIQNKVRAIELIDQQILGPVLEGLRQYDHYKILIMPDHPTPLSVRTHTADPVPFVIYRSDRECEGVVTLNEETAKETGIFIDFGPDIMPHFLNE